MTTTTVRSVRVELELGIDRYVANAKTAGRETDAAFDRAETRIAGTDKAVGRLETSTDRLARTTAQARIGQTQLSKGIDDVGRSSGRAESSIDKYSGRLKTILGLIQILGPAALRLGAGALPAITGGLVGLGAAAGGIGVTIAALSGIGDALKALDKYDTDRSAESLQAVRVELEKLGPDGAHFVKVLRDLGPELHNLQLLARAGVLPGFEDFIDSAITRLPIVEQIVNRLSKEVGRLATDAGESLAGDEWTPFFEYVRSQAAPILDDFARSTGNVALGLANILVAFDPLTQRFTGGLEEMTSEFADWSSELEDNEGFQSFLETVEDAGPELLDFLGSSIDLLVGLVRASAPLGAVTVPILTAIVKAFAAIANSPIGPPLYTAAAAMVAFGRASAIAEKSASRFSSTWAGLGKGGLLAGGIGALGLLASSLTDVDDKAGLANTTMLASAGLIAGGPWGLAIGAGIGVAADFAAAQGNLNDELERTREIAATGSLKEQQAEYERLSKEIGDTSFSLQRWLFGTEAQEQALAELEDSMSSTDALTTLFGRDMGLTAQQMGVAADSAGAFSDALADLNGWFDKRDSVRGYKDAIDELRESLKDGFSREDAANVDALGRSILQVANNIKSPKVRRNFLDGAREQLEDLAEHAGPKAEAALNRLIRKFDDEGLTHPKPIEPTVDDRRAKQGAEDLKRTYKTAIDFIGKQRAEPTIDADANPFLALHSEVTGDLNRLDRTTATPSVAVRAGNSLGILGQIAAAIRGIRDKTVTVTVNQRRGVTSSAGGRSSDAPGGADGMTVPGQRSPYGDKVLIHAAPGEEIISNRHGQADRFRADRAAGRIPAYAAGGTVADRIASTYTTRRGPDSGPWQEVTQGFHVVAAAADDATTGLKRLEKAADKVQKSYEKEKSKLDDLVSQRASAASSIASSALHDPFGNGLAGLDAQVDADSADLTAMSAALATLVKNGLDPKSALYQQLAAHMDLTTAQQLAQLSSTDLASRSQRFDAVQSQAAAFGQGVAGQAFNEAIAKQTKVFDRLDHRLDDLRDAIHDLKETPKKMHDAVYEGSKAGSHEGSESGTRQGADEKRRRTAAMVRTGT